MLSSFRFKLLAAFLALVVLFLGFWLVVLSFETTRQIRSSVELAARQSNQAFVDLEQLWQQELARLSLRFTDSNRIPGALEAALEEDSPQVLADAARYELRLAGMQDALAVFADVEGRPVIALLDGELVPWTKRLDPVAVADVDAEKRLGYEVVADSLWAVETVPLSIFGQLVGSVMMGSRIDEEVSQRLAEVIGAEICFVANGQGIMMTPRLVAEGLLERAVALGAKAQASVEVLEDRHWALLAEPLAAQDPGAGARVVALPLQQKIEPFERMQTKLRVAGLLGLLLAVGFGIVLSRGLSAPISELMRGTDRVAKGDLDFALEIRSRDELGRLAEAFNRMVVDLNLKRRYRSVLDKVMSREIAEEMLKGEIALGGENREVTVLFADIRGFTALTEGMEPQQVIELLNQLMDKAASAIQAEGGVVDKYVGDEVMAIFGAPLSHGNDALAAVRAGQRIQTAIAQLNEDRLNTGLPQLGVGIGVNTGVAVVGNMGSKDRLNYTVLGDVVNLAARLCAQAAPGQVLLSHATKQQVEDVVRTTELPLMVLKGFSQPIEVFSATEQAAACSQRDDGNRTGLLSAVVLGLVLALAPVFGHAGELSWDLPTLRGMGLGYVSDGGAFQLDLSGRLLLEAYDPGGDAAGLIAEQESFVAAELSLFVDVFLGERAIVVTELRLDRGETPTADDWEGRVEQAFVELSYLDSHALRLGRFVSPFGQWPQRHDTAADPFIRPPLPYDYRTMICPTIIPPSTERFVQWKDEAENFRPTGAPVVWGAAYQLGAMAAGRLGALSYRAAMMSSAPSSAPKYWNDTPGENYDPSYVAHLAVQVMPELELGVSYNIGPYLSRSVTAPSRSYQSSPGYSTSQYDQELWGVELTYTRGWTEVRGELLLDRWEVPNVLEDPEDTSYYLELKQKLHPGLSASLRVGEITYSSLPLANGERVPWDYDVRRVELGIGYRLARRLEVRAAMSWTHTDGPDDPDDDLLAVQLRWEF